MGYKVKPFRVYSKTSNSVASTEKKCFLGISIDSPFIGGKHVHRVLEWINSQYDECIILIGDDIHCYNEFILSNDLEQAKLKCTLLGEFAESRLKDALLKLPHHNLTILHWKYFVGNEEFNSNMSYLENQLETNKKFKSSILSCANKFLLKQKTKGHYPIISEQESLENSVKYIIEEMTVFSILINMGYSTLIYPGSILQIFKDIIEESLSNFKSILENGTYIELTIKKL
jgi:tRNA-dependent cyclodipeptide synthase